MADDLRSVAPTSAERFVRYYGEDVCAARPFYNFGAGRWKHKFFQNMDIVHPKYPHNKPDIEYDAMSMAPFPIETGSAKLFFFSHVNEHMSDRTNAFIFSEVRRCLAPDGAVRFVYPDYDCAVRAFERSDREFFVADWKRRDEKDPHNTLDMADYLLGFFATRALTISPNDGNRKYSAAEFRELIAERGYEGAAHQVASGLSEEVQAKAPGCHMNWWNYAKFERMLGEVGLKAERSAYMQSGSPPMRDKDFFDRAYPVMSGYVEARPC